MVSRHSREAARPKARSRVGWAVGLVALGVVMLTLAFWLREPALEWLTSTAESLRQAGALGAAALVLLGALWMLVLLPLSAVFLVLGALYGPVQGTALAFLVNALGGAVAFILGRTLLRRRVLHRLQDSRRFMAIDRAVADEGLRAALLLRAGPIPGWILNYGLGATSMKLGTYLLASVSLLPLTALFALSGAALGDLAGVGAQSSAGVTSSPWFWLLFSLGSVATATMVWQIRRHSERLLQEDQGDSSAKAQ